MQTLSTISNGEPADPPPAYCAPASTLARILSARLRQWRLSRRIPLKRMAAELGVSISTISAWERGARFPSASHLERLSARTGLPVSRLLYEGPGEDAGASAGQAQARDGFYLL